MEFEFYIKSKENRYELRLVKTIDTSRNFFSNLLKNIEIELENIRADLLKIDGVNLIQPSHEDKIINEKIEKLVMIRKINLNMKEQIKDLLSENEFIICRLCGSKMFKFPLDTKFKRIGNGYIIDSENNVNIAYAFRCSNCVLSESEELYHQGLHNLKIREQLLEEGYNFVPNEFGMWHYEGEGCRKKPTEGDKIPDYTYRRVSEKVKEGDVLKLHVYDICIETGEKIKIF